jgi:hypothetical protein
MLSRTVFALILVLGSSPSGAEGSGLQTRSRGVTVSTYRIASGFLFCLRSNENTKIAAEYGIELKIPSQEQTLWSEAFPKLVTRPQTYFDLPLAVEVKSPGTARRRHVNLHLGICVDARYCEPIDIPVTIPSSAELIRDRPCGG